MKSFFEPIPVRGFNSKVDVEHRKQQYLTILVDITSFCQEFVKNLDNKASSLSLRDVYRVKIIFKFYWVLLAYKKQYTALGTDFESFRLKYPESLNTVDDTSFVICLIVTTTLNYVNRITCPIQKTMLKNSIINKIRNHMGFPETLMSFDHVINSQYDLIIHRVQKLKKLPKNIAVNIPLRENLFAIVVAVYSQTPSFICGKPGSSKSISVHIIKKTFSGQTISDQHDFLNGMKPLRIYYYQGSNQSTDKGIEKVFKKAQFYQNRGKFQCVVFIDEIGFAELSSNNPLKILHKFLDTTSHDVRQGMINLLSITD